MSADMKVIIIMGVLALIAIVLGIVISAEESVTERIYSSGSKGE